MDFRNRNGQPSQQVHSTPAASAHVPQNIPIQKQDKHWSNIPNWVRVANVIMLFSITVLAVAIVLLMRNNNPNEAKFIAEDKYQAVFLENGQVYFGKVSNMNPRYLNLQNVFYLNSQSQTANGTEKNTKADQFTLIKLGCELHGPYDQMIINRDQITFWENLKDDGQVVKTINEWAKQNPNGQKCSTSTDSTNQSTTNNQQSGANTQNTTPNGTTTGN